MEIEQNAHLPKIFTAYARYYHDNPIYYQNAFQFLGGGFYRRILGYENLWDRDYEGRMNKALDYVLTDLEKRRSYYLEDLVVNRDAAIHGIKWVRGLAPRKLEFNTQWIYELKANERLTVRVNLLDKPNHVDIERENGEVFSVQYLRYQNYKNRSHFKNRKASASLIEPIRSLYPKPTLRLSAMR